MKRVRASRIKAVSVNGNINQGCVSPSITNLNSLKSKLEIFQQRLANSKLARSSIIAVSASMGTFCGFGRSVTHWNSKYPTIRDAQLEYGQTSYCEVKYLKASYQLLLIQIPVLEGEVLKYSNLVTAEQNLYNQSLLDYESCVTTEAQFALDEAVRLEAEAVKLAEEAIKLEAETGLTEVETEQIIAKEAATTEQIKNYLPYAALAAGVIGLAIYLNPRKKRRR